MQLIRGWKIIVIFGSVGLLFAICLANLQARLFIATGTLLVDPDGGIEQQTLKRDWPQSSARVDSQAEIIRSRKISCAVVRKLKLEDDPEFRPRKSLLGRLKYFVTSGLSSSDPDYPQTDADGCDGIVVSSVLKRLTVSRVNTTYVLEVSAASDDSRKAAQIVNSFLSEYLSFLKQLRSEAAEQAAAWMKERIAEASKQSIASEMAVQDFKREEDELERSIDNGANATAFDRLNRRRIRLRELEASSQNFTKLHDIFLQRYNQIVNEASYPIVDVRIVSPASAPEAPSFPRINLMLAAGLLLGAACGGAIVMFRPVFRSRTEGRFDDTECINYFGSVRFSQARRHHWLGINGLRRLVNKLNHASHGNKIAFYADARHEASEFSRVAQDLEIVSERLGAKSIGCVAWASGEGVTTFAANFASHIAKRGKRVLLVDANFRNPILHDSIVGHVLRDGVRVTPATQLSDRILFEENHRIWLFCPAQREFISRRDFFSRKVIQGIQESFSHFDHVIYDISPLSGDLDAMFMSNYIDKFILITKERTSFLPDLSRVIKSYGLDPSVFIGAVTR